METLYKKEKGDNPPRLYVRILYNVGFRCNDETFAFPFFSPCSARRGSKIYRGTSISKFQKWILDLQSATL